MTNLLNSPYILRLVNLVSFIGFLTAIHFGFDAAGPLLLLAIVPLLWVEKRMVAGLPKHGDEGDPQ